MCVQKLIWQDQKAVAPLEFSLLFGSVFSSSLLRHIERALGERKKNEICIPTFALFLYIAGHLLSHFSCHKKVYTIPTHSWTVRESKKDRRHTYTQRETSIEFFFFFFSTKLMTENRNRLKAFHLEK